MEEKNYPAWKLTGRTKITNIILKAFISSKLGEHKYIHWKQDTTQNLQSTNWLILIQLKTSTDKAFQPIKLFWSWQKYHVNLIKYRTNVVSRDGSRVKGIHNDKKSGIVKIHPPCNIDKKKRTWDYFALNWGWYHKIKHCDVIRYFLKHMF